MSRAGQIVIPAGGGPHDGPVFAPNDLIESMRSFVEEFWSGVLGTSYETSFVSNRGCLEAWEHYVGGRDALIARVVDVYGVDISEVYDHPAHEVLEFVRRGTTRSRVPLTPAETVQLIGFARDGGLANLFRELAIYDDFKIVLPDVLTKMCREQFAKTIIHSIELLAEPDCVVDGAADPSGQLTSVRTVEASLPLAMTLQVESSSYRLDLQLSIRVTGVDNWDRRTSFDWQIKNQVALP